MHLLRLGADYKCWPLWEAQDLPNNVDPFTLPITENLASALVNWADEYTATLNRSDPLRSGFPDLPSAEAWLQKGADLAVQFRQEVAEAGYGVEYGHAAVPLRRARTVVRRTTCGHAAVGPAGPTMPHSGS